MKRFRFIPFILPVAVLFAGCLSFASSKSDEDKIAVTQPADTTGQVYSDAIHVLVDGRDAGPIPATVRVRRSFGTLDVMLWQAGEEIRRYEIEHAVTSDGQQLRQGFWGTPSEFGSTYDVQNLPRAGDHTFRVPYSPYPIRVEDREYGVTLLVQE